MTYGYYPGCSLESTGAEFDISFKAVFSRLGFSLKETKGWTCCGTSAVHNVSHLAAIALPIDNLIGYRDEGLESVVIPCASCFQRFKVAAVSNDHCAPISPSCVNRTRPAVRGRLSSLLVTTSGHRNSFQCQITEESPNAIITGVDGGR